ncbi:hypothetical protein Tco_0828124 [Tanacetum coccineum]
MIGKVKNYDRKFMGCDFLSPLRELRPEAQGEVFEDGLGLEESFESDLAVHDFDGFFDEMKLVVNLNFISRNGKGFIG